MTGRQIVWVGGDCGHWEFRENGIFVRSCDRGERTETIEELGW